MQVLNIEDTISINHNWITAASIPGVTRFLLCEFHSARREIQQWRGAAGSSASDPSMMEPLEWHSHCQLLLRADAGMDIPELIRMLSHFAARAAPALSSSTSSSLTASHISYGVGTSGDGHTPDAKPLPFEAEFELRQVKRALERLLNDDAVQDAAGERVTHATLRSRETSPSMERAAAAEATAAMGGAAAARGAVTLAGGDATTLSTHAASVEHPPVLQCKWWTQASDLHAWVTGQLGGNLDHSAVSDKGVLLGGASAQQNRATLPHSGLLARTALQHVCRPAPSSAPAGPAPSRFVRIAGRHKWKRVWSSASITPAHSS